MKESPDVKWYKPRLDVDICQFVNRYTVATEKEWIPDVYQYKTPTVRDA